jgi:hypothetical protein
MEAMVGLAGQTEHQRFHEGLERLGRCLGAQPTRTNEQGAPDVVWSFEEDVHVVFEAKSEKSEDGIISKGDVLQANGHVDWVKDKLASAGETARIVPVIVCPASNLHDAARPHTAGLYLIHPKEISNLAQTTYDVLSELRTAFAGSDFGGIKDTLCAKLKLSNLHVDGVIELLERKAL